MKTLGVLMTVVSCTCAVIVFFTIPSSSQHNRIVQCSASMEDHWVDIGGGSWIHAYSSGHAEFDSVQDFEASCGVELSERTSEYPVDSARLCPTLHAWNGVPVRAHFEDQGHRYRAFVVREVGDGIEVFACGGTD